MPKSKNLLITMTIFLFSLFALVLLFSGRIYALPTCDYDEPGIFCFEEIDASECGKPNAVCCNNGNEDPNCPGPWSAVDYQCWKCERSDGEVCAAVREPVWTFTQCPTSDVCGNGSNVGPNVTHQISSGTCNISGWTVSCSIGGWYKSCCNSDGSTGMCVISGPGSDDCNPGTATSPGVTSCPQPATHLECVNNTCTVVSGSGSNQCSTAGSGCGGYSCSGSSCSLSNCAPNGSTCFSTSNCDDKCVQPPPTGCGQSTCYACSGNSCVQSASGPYSTSSCGTGCGGRRVCVP